MVKHSTRSKEQGGKAATSSARSIPPPSPQQLNNINEAVEDMRIDEAPASDLVPPPQGFAEDSNKWTPDVQLEEAVNGYFEALSEATGRRTQFKMLHAEEPARQEYRNMFMVMKVATNQNEKWQKRLDAAKARNEALRGSSRAMRESIAKLQAETKDVFAESKKYSVDHAAQKAALDLINIRFEELNMDASLAEEREELMFDVSDPELNSSSDDVAKYSELIADSALAKFSMNEVAILVSEIKKNMDELAKIKKRSRELTKQLVKSKRRLKTAGQSLGRFKPVVDEICASEAWKKKHGLL